VQDPDETPFSGMAMSVLDDGGADYVVPVADIGPLVAQLVGEELPAEATMDHDGYDEVELDPDGLANERTGAPSPFACPDCNGVLWEEPESAPLRFRCRVGHAWTAESLVAEQSQEVETALWAAVRMLQEKAALSRRLAQRSHQRGRERSAARFHDQEREARRLSDTIERIIGEGTAQQGNTRDNEVSGN
jgi:two-component system chemotaxis response regulator CheB